MRAATPTESVASAAPERADDDRATDTDRAADHGSPAIRTLRGVAQAALGAVLLTAGTGHLTTQRQEFQAQVPSWFPIDTDVVVVASGVVELSLGTALLVTWKHPWRAFVGAIVATFFVAIFPGNIAQFLEGKNGFGLDTDTKRAVRLLFQPLLVLWALGATNAVPVLRAAWRARRRNA